MPANAMSLIASSVATPPGLISDSRIVADLVELLRARGGYAPVTFVADFILENGADFPPPTAALFISDIIGDDERFRLTTDHHLELVATDWETCNLQETDFVVVDVETTGAKTPECRITEIGAYRVSRGSIVAEFASLVNPETAIPPFISGLTGITDEMVRDAPPFSAISAGWLRFIEGAVLVAHNAPFDIRFINCELARLYPERRMANPHICTVSLTRHILPELASHRLDSVAEHFRVPVNNRHRASGDALATAHIFINLLDLLRAHDVRLLADARNFRASGRTSAGRRVNDQ